MMISLKQIIDSFIDRHLTARGDVRSTLRWYRTRLGQFRKWMEEERPDLQSQDLEDEDLLEAYVASLYVRGLKTQTVNGHIRIIRAFYTYLVARRHITHNAAKCLHKKDEKGRVPRAISRQVRKHILDTAYQLDDAYTQRDYALLLFLADSGARAGEVCSMDIDTIDMERLHAAVIGKRGRRTVVFSPAARSAVEKYLETEREALLSRLIALGLIKPGSPESRKVWLGSKGPLTYWGVRMLLKRVIKDARARVDQETVDEIEHSPTSAHAFRHAFARNILQNGGSLTEVRDQLGHQSITVTEIYSCWAIGERHQLHAKHTEVAREAKEREQTE